MQHPFSQFQAPSHIAAGSCLADLFNATSIALIGESFASVTPGFSVGSFEQEAGEAGQGLALKAKVSAIAKVLRKHLPTQESAALDCLRGAWGPPLKGTEKNGLAPMIYMPLGVLLEGFSTTQDDAVFRDAVEANFELTTRFTAEFSIRPFLEGRQAQTLSALKDRLNDPNPHIRRLASEGTRPRLPWAPQLHAFRSDPSHCLPILIALRDDPCRYVTRSVANHLGDIGKDHPEILFQTSRTWLEALDSHPPAPDAFKERKWLIRHALRHPARKGHPTALRLRTRAGAKR
jgi:3-methyladenine DNA glycosylase AlkC